MYFKLLFTIKMYKAVYDTRLGDRVSVVTSKRSFTEVSFYAERCKIVSFFFVSACLWHFLAPCDTHHVEIVPVPTTLEPGVPKSCRKTQASGVETAIVTECDTEGDTSAEKWRRENYSGAASKGKFLKKESMFTDQTLNKLMGTHSC